MLKLNVGFNRKAGEANFGSRGACVNLELELESSLVGDPDRLKDRIRQLFVLAKASVYEELAGCTAVETAANGNGKAASNGHGNGHSRDNTRRATASQVRAINAIAERRRIDVAELLSQRFGIRDPAELAITEASALIDELKTAGNGAGGRR